MAILQPYFFPYLGYFQLIAHADRFVVYDDVAFIKNGWINRNRILLGGDVHYLTVPVHAKMGEPISHIALDPQPNLVRKLRARLENGYAKAPYRDEGLAAFDAAMEGPPSTIGDLARRSILEICRRLGIRTRIIASSASYGNQELHATARIVDICRREGATEYCNSPGGRELYQPKDFEAAGLRLRFLAPDLPPYPQQNVQGFVPALSILDVLMNVGPEAAGAMATRGSVVE